MKKIVLILFALGSLIPAPAYAHGGHKHVIGTISSVESKTLVVKTADGTEETYRLTVHAAKDAGKDIAKGTEKSAKVTVYYTEQGGRKVAHFFKSL